MAENADADANAKPSPDLSAPTPIVTTAMGQTSQSAAGTGQLVSEEIPASDEQAASLLFFDLWRLSAQPARGRFWTLRRRPYERLLSSYCEIYCTLAMSENRRYLKPALVGVRHLREGNFSVSSAILENIKLRTLPGEAIGPVMRGLFRLICSLFGAAYVSAIIATSAAEGQDFGSFSFPSLSPDVRNVLCAFGAGMLGSAVSLLSRISEFENVSVRSRRYLLFTGATSPIVGGITAFVIAALIQSKLVSLEIAGQNFWVFIVVGFLSGFSERFSGNLLRIAQGRLVAGDEKPEPERSVARSLSDRGSGVIAKT